MDLGELVGMTPEIIQKVSHTLFYRDCHMPSLSALGPGARVRISQ